MRYNEQMFRAMGEKIRAGRKSKGWSQDDFLELLCYQYDCRIARKRLSGIENGHTGDFDLTVLLAVCDIFGWDMGYLFGEYEEKTHENHMVCEATGLSEQAVEKVKLLHEYDSRTWWLSTLNKVIEHPEFADFIHAAAEYTDSESSVELVADNICFTERKSNSKDIAALKAQRLLFRILDSIPEPDNDNRPLYSFLYSLKDKNGWSEAELSEHLAKLDRGDLSDFKED